MKNNIKETDSFILCKSRKTFLCKHTKKANDPLYCGTHRNVQKKKEATAAHQSE